MKINILKPTGSEVLPLLSAFNVEGNTYVIFDSERTSPMGLPTIYVSKLTTKLEKISDSSEWERVKSYLKGIISGTNFLYVNVPEVVNADDAYYVQLLLPSTSAFDLIKTRYVVPAKVEDISELKPEGQVNPLVNEAPVLEAVPPVNNAINEPAIEVTNEVAPNVIPTTPIIPASPKIEEPANDISASIIPPIPEEPKKDFNFDNDKETFLKACENMFDALIAKFQNSLAELEKREQALTLKEKELDEKIAQANEHLANAQAREQIANIAHDNAQKITNNIPDGNETAVI